MQVFCTKQIKKYIVDLEFSSSTSVRTIYICQLHAAGLNSQENGQNFENLQCVFGKNGKTD